jgi:hypothetical protein
MQLEDILSLCKPKRIAQTCKLLVARRIMNSINRVNEETSKIILEEQETTNFTGYGPDDRWFESR